METLLTPAQLAEVLGVATGTLADWRLKNEGPQFYRVGKHVRYRPSDIDAWLDERTSKQD